MPRTPDHFPGERLEEAIQFISSSTTPNNVAEMMYVSGSGFMFNDEGTQVRFRRRLQHFIDDGPTAGFPNGSYKETLGGTFPSDEIWWESAAKLKKIVHLEITRSILTQAPTTERWRQYSDDGVTVLETVVDTISYAGAVETVRSRSIA